MENYFAGNLKLLRNHKKRSQQELADFIGITRSMVNNYEHKNSNPSLKILMAISEFFSISLDTFVKINFSKLSVSELSALARGEDKFSNGSNLRILATTVNEKNRDNVEMVNIKAKAGYAAGYGDPEFINKLPSYYFPLLPKERKHRLFQLSGDSMPPAKDKEWIACEYVEDWNSIKDGAAYIIVTKDDGVVFKICYNQIKSDNQLLLISLNMAYKPYEISIFNIREVWKYSMRFTGDLEV